MSKKKEEKVIGIEKQESSSTKEQLLIEQLKKQIKYMGNLLDDCNEYVRIKSNNKETIYSLPFYQCMFDDEFIHQREEDSRWCPYCSNCNLHCKCGYIASLKCPTCSKPEDVCECSDNSKE